MSVFSSVCDPRPSVGQSVETSLPNRNMHCLVYTAHTCGVIQCSRVQVNFYVWCCELESVNEHACSIWNWLMNNTADNTHTHTQIADCDNLPLDCEL